MSINKTIMEVKERVINLLSEKLGYDKLEIKENQDFVTDLGTDSLDMAEIVMGIEDEFGLVISDDEIIQVKTVGDLIKKIENKRMGR
jgi:acyl carrier protein